MVLRAAGPLGGDWVLRMDSVMKRINALTKVAPEISLGPLFMSKKTASVPQEVSPQQTANMLAP